MKKTYLLALLLFCLSHQLHAQAMHDTVSREDKLYALSMIWKEADYNFVFFDKQPHLNWDSLYVAYIPKILATKNVYEYEKVLSSFIGNLKDGHTSIMVNQPYWNDIDSPPVRYTTHDGKIYVTAVDSVLKEQIAIHSQIIKLDGKTWDDPHNTDDWYGFKNTTVELTLLLPNGKQSNVTLTRNVNTLFRAHKLKMIPVVPSGLKNFEYKSLSPTVALVTLNTFGDSSVVSDFRQALPEIRKHKTLILDIRKNQGGNDTYAIAIAKYLTDKPYMVGSMWSARTNNSAKKAWASAANMFNTPVDSLEKYVTRNSWEKHPGDTITIADTIHRLNMPIYILTSQKTFSAAEDFLIYLNGSKNITRVGQNTAGSSGQPLYFNIPKGFTVRICAKRDAFPDGTDFIGMGIKPDVYVEPFFSLMGEQKDVELEKALSLINGKKE